MNLRDFLILKHNLQPQITKPKIGQRAFVSPVRDISKDSTFQRKKVFLTKALAYVQNKLHNETLKEVEADPFQRKRGHTFSNGLPKGKLVGKAIKQLEDFMINIDEARKEEPRESIASNKPDGLYTLTAINSHIPEPTFSQPPKPPKLEKVFSAPDLAKVVEDPIQRKGNSSPFNLVYQSQAAFRKPVKNFYLRKKQISLQPCPIKPFGSEPQTTKNEKKMGRKTNFNIKLGPTQKNIQMRGLLPPIISPKRKPIGIPTLRKVSSGILGRAPKDQNNDQNYDRFFLKVEGILEGAQRYVNQITKKRKYKVFSGRKKVPQKVQGILGTQQFVMEATNSEIDLLEKSQEK